MYYDYSNRYYIPSETERRYTSPRREYYSESYIPRYEEPIYVKQEPSNYFLQLQNEDLANSLLYEQRARVELDDLIHKRSNEIDSLKRSNEIRDKEIASLKFQYEESEKMRKDQSRFIDSLQKEIDQLREMMAKVGVNELPKVQPQGQPQNKESKKEALTSKKKLPTENIKENKKATVGVKSDISSATSRSKTQNKK